MKEDVMKIYTIDNHVYYLPMKKMIVQTRSGISNLLESDTLKNWLSSFESHEKEMLQAPNEQFSYKDSHAYSIGIIPTNRCNLRCIYCYSETGDIIDKDMTKGQVDTIINMLVKNAIIHKMAGENNIKCQLSFCGGGEPTFNQDLFKYAVKAFKRKCAEYKLPSYICLVTNGVMNDDMIEFIIAHVDQVNISFDSNEAVQNRQRPVANRTPSFPLVEKTIKTFMQRNKHILIRSTVLPTEFEKLSEIAEDIFSKYANVDVFHAEPLFLVGRGKQLCEPSESSLMRFMYNYIDAYEYVCRRFPGKKMFNSSFQYQLQNFGCGAAIGVNPWVHMDGNILPCTDYLSDPHNSIGHVYDNCVEFNRDYKTLAENQVECRKCFAFYQCGGGCARNIVKDEKGCCIDSYSKAYCNVTKEFWRIAFNKLINNQSICGMKPVQLNVSQINDVDRACLIVTEDIEG